jgi:hypothetical protein
MTELVDALSKEIKLNQEKEQANIKEMLALYPRLLPWGPPSKDVAHVLSIMARTVYRRLFRTGKLDYLKQLVELLREARKVCQPKDHLELSIDLADLLMLLTLFSGFQRDHSEEMKELANEATSFLPPDHPRRLEPLYTLMLSNMFQLAAGHRDVDSFANVINSMSTVIDALSTSGTESPSPLLPFLLIMLNEHHRNWGNKDSLEEAHASTGEALNHYEPLDLPSHYCTSDSWVNQMCSLHNSWAFLANRGTFGTSLSMSSLPFPVRNHDVVDLKEASKSFQQVVSSSPNIPGNAPMMAIALLQAHLSDNHKIPDKLIDTCQSIIEAYPTHPLRFRLLALLAGGLCDRHKRTHHSEDFIQIISTLKTAFEQELIATSDRFIVASLWAYTARCVRHPSTSLAYESALSVMQMSFSQGPTVETQHMVIENLGQDINIPLQYASYQIGQGQIESAVKTVEYGRALLWSEMRGLRTSIDQLRIVDSAPADRFQTVSQAIEAIATTTSQHQAAEFRHGALGGRGELDAFSHMLRENHKL